jgi:hypothetical protein
VHLSWSWQYDGKYGYSVSREPLSYLFWHSSRLLDAPASFTVDLMWERLYRFTPPVRNETLPNGRMDDERQVDLDTLRSQQTVSVVIRVIVAHSSSSEAMQSGLLGPHGDAPIQIVDAASDALIEAYYGFAEQCDANSARTIPQDLRRPSFAELQIELRTVLLQTFKQDGLLATLRPAIMFRHCTRQCNKASASV